ncbi:Inosine_triphosphatase / Nucleoside-triphosphate diphosphatase [Hexamita inflata]|uniref:Inosine triphosphate pyrophosphatase n=1 Tax=Hexamita inflata TaxID=28002 RepID=A0AA86RP63_9EUKA|nr:Inosine triphosphatase / Nucleoside-triphosphate diphosphatase [Hexamita inflata]
MSKPLCLVTGNKHKVEEFAQLMDGKISWTSLKLDVPELQGLPEEVAREKCRAASKLYNGPVITEDVSFCINSLGGMPGVYIRYFLESVGPDGIYNLLSAFEDKSAFAQCIYAYSTGPDAEPVLFIGQCPGKVVKSAGISQFGAISFDSIFAPDNCGGKTFAEMDKEEKNKISHRGLASAKMQQFFVKGDIKE